MAKPHLLLLLGLSLGVQVLHAQQKLIIHYPTNKYLLTEVSRRSIDSLLATGITIATVSLDGFTDNTGSDAYNEKMSIKRVTEVLNYLQGKGITHTQIEQKFYGKGKPLVPNTSSANRAMNRRTEMTVTFNSTPNQPTAGAVGGDGPPSISKPAATTRPHDVIRVYKSKNGTIINCRYLADSIHENDSVIPGVAGCDLKGMILLETVDQFVKSNMYTMTVAGQVLTTAVAFRPSCWGDTSIVDMAMLVPLRFISPCNAELLKAYQEVPQNDGQIKWQPANIPFKIVTTDTGIYLSLKVVQGYERISFAYPLNAPCLGGATELELRIKGLHIKSITAMLEKSNAVYTPKQEKRNVFKIMVVKGNAADVALNIAAQPRVPKDTLTDGPMSKRYQVTYLRNLLLVRLSYVGTHFFVAGKVPKRGYYVLRRKDVKKLARNISSTK